MVDDALRRAGDVNPLIDLVACCRNQGTDVPRSPVLAITNPQKKFARQLELTLVADGLIKIFPQGDFRNDA